MTPGSPLRRCLKAIPGLAPAYRSARSGWRWLRGRRAEHHRQQRVAQVWGETLAPAAGPEAAQMRPWLSWGPVVQRYVYAQLGGLDFYRFAKLQLVGRRLERGLSLCCGDGCTERNLLFCGVCRDWEGVDISPQAIAACRRAAETGGLSASFRYRVANVERLRLPRARYDVIAGWMGLHHLHELPRVFRQVKRALRPGGVLVVNEYVGPARFQLPPRQVELVNECLALLPPELRRASWGEIKEQFSPPSVAEVLACDPSEAASSDQILPLLDREFSIKLRVDYGGAILQWVLLGITGSFQPENAEHMAWLDRICDFERQAMQRGDIGSDFSFLLAERPE